MASRAADHIPEDVLGHVLLCSRDAEMKTVVLQFVADGVSLIGIQHQWLLTSHKEAGMNAAPGQDCDNCPYETQTAIVDQTGRHLEPGVECTPVLSVDEHCVDEMLDIGRDLGTWTLTNQCNAFAPHVLDICSTTPPDPIDFDPVKHGAGMR